MIVIKLLSLVFLTQFNLAYIRAVTFVNLCNFILLVKIFKSLNLRKPS